MLESAPLLLEWSMIAKGDAVLVDDASLKTRAVMNRERNDQTMPLIQNPPR
jgi:hypothetical protein